ncbi:MAG: cyclophilin-like fold protein [bacterium]
MVRKIRITAGDIREEASLLEAPAADLLWDALPITGRANIWGEEIYFEIPLDAPAEPAAREEMEVGEIAFWPPGKAFCIFFGPTPASTGDAPRAASPVNPLGKITGDPKQFLNVPHGADVHVERA